MSKLELYLSKIVQCGLYAILLTPLVFWPRALYAFMTPKFILFQVLVEIVFGAWLILRFLLRFLKSDFSRSPTSRSKLFLALSAFFAISFISALFGVDFGRSFWGIGARMTGLFAELHFLAWFLVLISFFRLKSDFSRSPTSRSSEVGLQIPKSDFSSYLNFSFFVALLVALSAFYQNTEWRLVYGSTLFNNPTFVAPYLLFHFFWGLYLTIKNQLTINNWERWFFGLGTAFLALVIFLGEVRGAILGFFIGLIIFALGLIFSDAIKRRFKILLLAFFVAILSSFAGLWLTRESAFVQNISALKRLTQVSLEQTTFQTRFAAWRIAALGFKEHPLFGVGLENFNYVFNAHYNPTLLKYGLGETWFDKPHNAFLQILTENGAVGGLAYLLILVTVAFALFKLFKSSQKILALILMSAFIAYLSSMFFSFDSFGSWFGLYLFLAFLASRSNTNNTNYNANNTNKNFFKNIFVLLVCLGLFVLLYISYGIWRANIVDADALRIFSQDQVQGIAYFKRSFDYFTPYKAEYQFDLIASVAGALAKNLPIPQLEDNLNFALDEADKAVKAHPQNAAYYTDMIKLYNILGEKGRNPEILNQAEMFGKKSLELSLNRQETMFYLAQTALLKGDAKLAVKLTKNAVDIEPSIHLSHWYLGLALIANNQRSEGKIEIKKALELGYKPQNAAEETFIKNIGL